MRRQKKSGDRFPHPRNSSFTTSHAALLDLSAAPRPDAPTALVMVSIDANGVPNYAFYGAGTAERMVHLHDLERVPEGAAAIHAGSYCMVVEPVASTTRALIERQHGRSVIAYDMNVRLTIEPRIKLWQDALQWMLARTDILKVSDEDIHALYPSMTVASFIAMALEQGVSLVVVTRGAQGVAAATQSVPLFELPALPVAVIDTVGAGDTFQAGLLASLERSGRLDRDAIRQLDRATLGDALLFAACAAAITCSRRGADLPYLGDVISAS